MLDVLDDVTFAKLLGRPLTKIKSMFPSHSSAFESLSKTQLQIEAGDENSYVRVCKAFTNVSREVHKVLCGEFQASRSCSIVSTLSLPAPPGASAPAPTPTPAPPPVQATPAEQTQRYKRSKPGEVPLKEIVFHSTHAKPPAAHPSSSACGPDGVAVERSYLDGVLKEQAKKNIPEDADPLNSVINWPYVKATMEIKPQLAIKAQPEVGKATISSVSQNVTGADLSKRQGYGYALMLLAARPERTTVTNINMTAERFQLVICNAIGVVVSRWMQWDDYESRVMFCAWLVCLHSSPPEWRDVSINPHGEIGEVHYTFPDTPGIPDALKFKLTTSRVAFGRRTSVFVDTKHETVVKEQYVPEWRKDNEATMLKKLKGIPGVIKLFGSQTDLCSVTFGEGEGMQKRHKVRLYMEYGGSGFLEAESLDEAVRATYDLIEVMRIIWRQKEVIHGDISDTNVLINDEKPEQVTDPLKKPEGLEGLDVGDLCFCSHILDEKVSKYHSRIKLADFDLAIDRSIQSSTSDAVTGTPVFIARAVAKNDWLKPRLMVHPRIPMLESELLGAVRRVYSKRLESFPANEPELISPQPHKVGIPFERQPRHDVESAFFLLAWWMVFAQPQDGEIKDAMMDPYIYTQLTSDVGIHTHYRDGLLRGWPEENLFHREYEKGNTLLAELSSFIAPELQFATDASRKNPEYIFEATQRVLIRHLWKERTLTRPKSVYKLRVKRTDTDQATYITSASQAGKSKRESDSSPESRESKRQRTHYNGKPNPNYVESPIKAKLMTSPTLELIPLPNIGLLSSARTQGSDAGTQASNTAFPHSTDTDTQFWMGSDDAGDA